MVEKSGLDRDRIRQFLELLFEHVETGPASEFHAQIDRAESAIGHVDPDDVLYLACAVSADAAIWSDDTDFREQDLVPVYGTSEVIDTFDAGL